MIAHFLPLSLNFSHNTHKHSLSHTCSLFLTDGTIMPSLSVSFTHMVSISRILHTHALSLSFSLLLHLTHIHSLSLSHTQTFSPYLSLSYMLSPSTLSFFLISCSLRKRKGEKGESRGQVSLVYPLFLFCTIIDIAN